MKIFREKDIADFINSEYVVENFSVNDMLFEIEYDLILLVEGNLHIKEDLDVWYNKQLQNAEIEDYDATIILINGNLIVKGRIAPASEAFPFLYVNGNVECHILDSYDEWITISKNAYIKYVFDGNYNDGLINIYGITHSPFILNSNHSSNVTPSKNSIIINYGHINNTHLDYDFNGNLEKILLSELIDSEELDPERFKLKVMAGKSPFINIDDENFDLNFDKDKILKTIRPK